MSLRLTKRTNRLQFLEKGAVIGIALFLSLSSAAKNGTPAHLKTIKKAQELSLKQERQKATQLLVQNILREGKKSEAGKAYLAALEQLSSMFYSDKGQRTFELAETRYFSKTTGAIDKYKETIELEKGNMQAILALTRAYLANNQPEQALTTLELCKDSNPFAREIPLLRARAHLINGSLEEASKYLFDKTIDTAGYELYWLAVKTEYAYEKKDVKEAARIAKSLVERDTEFPEGYYWHWRTNSSDPVASLESAQKYVSLCKNMTSKVRRKYKDEPALCTRQAELEGIVEKTSQNQGDT